MNFGNTAITCLPDYGNITNSTPPLHSLPLCGIYNPTGCQTFWNISGQSYYDQNNNCSFDNVDAGTNYVKTQLYSGGNLQQQVYSGSEGFYSFNAVSYGNYTVQVDTTNLPFIVSCPGSGYHAVTLSASDSLSYSNNFAFKCRTEGFDIGVHSVLNNYAVPRPNATITLNTIAGDISELYGAHCATGISGQVQITYTGELTYTGPAPGALTPDNVTGNTITWNIADFGTVNIFTAFNLMFHVNMFATPGTQACFTVSVTPTNGDYNPDNNTSSYCLTIVNSLDPNEKEVSPTGNVQSADEWLTYTIRFQNTGSAPALNVRITDTLDSNLDPSTFELLAYSAANLTQIFGNDVVFNFPNINLPDSATSDSASRGYVQYKIKLRDNLGTTAQIQNTANIYFDFNEPIVTNTTQNTFCNTIYTDTFITTTCGQLIFFNNYFFSLPGLYYDSIPGQSGCDSIITTLHLSVVNDTINQFAGLCTGDSISFYGTYIHATGVYNTILPSQNLCDTIVTLSVVVHAPIPPTYLYDTLCDGDSIAFDGAYIYTSGTYTAHFNSQHGCDSSVVLNLTVLPPAQPTNIYNTICTGDSLFFGGSFIKTTGTYTSHLNTQYGCDSAVVLNLSVLSQAPTTYIYDTICTGDIINFNGNFIYATGIYTAHYSPEGVCDSTVILSLTVMAPVPVTYIYDTICQGYSLPFNGGFADTAGTYTAHYNTPYGCDSIVVLQLHTTITANLVLSANLCSHDSLYFYGTYLHQPGIYLDTVPATGTGCDTLVSLHIFPLSLTASVYDTICEGDSIEFNGSIYNTSGTHTATLLTEGGCDSSVTLFITVIPTPVVTFTWDSLIATQDVYSIYGYHDTAFWCVDIFPYKFRLTGGSPPGGYYTGAGVSGDSINLFPVYNFGFYFTDTITYTYADGPGCAQSVSKILAYSPCEGINEVNANTLFTLYPNPAKDYVTIETDLSAIGGTLQITDVTGRTVDRLQVTGSKLQVNTNQFSAGVYFVKLSDKQGRNATVKLVIQ